MRIEILNRPLSFSDFASTCGNICSWQYPPQKHSAWDLWLLRFTEHGEYIYRPANARMWGRLLDSGCQRQFTGKVQITYITEEFMQPPMLIKVVMFQPVSATSQNTIQKEIAEGAGKGRQRCWASNSLAANRVQHVRQEVPEERAAYC